MRKVSMVAAGLMGVALLSGCGKRGYDRARPDEFAVARQAPLVIPPDFSLVPPQPGAAPASTGGTASQQALSALFGGPAPRSGVESQALQSANGTADPGIRSAVGDPDTNVVDKGQTTRDIVAAPEGDGREARAATGGATTAAPATAAPTTTPTTAP